MIGAREFDRELVSAARTAQGLHRAEPQDLQEKGHFDYVFETLALPPDAVFMSRVRLGRRPHTGRTEHPNLRVATPVAGMDDQTHGLIVIDLDVAILFDHLKIEAPQYADLYLANAEGDFLLHPDPTKIFGFEQGHRFLNQEQFPPVARILTESASELVADI